MQRPSQNRITVKATLSGSFKRDFEGLQMAYQTLKDQGIEILSPVNLAPIGQKEGFVYMFGQDALAPADIEQAHLNAIKDSHFVWLHAPDGYVGTSAALEVGYAWALKIPVFTTSHLQDPVLRAMVRQVPEMKFGTYTGLLIYNEHYDGYLTLHFPQKKERKWRFAGGKVEPGESIIVAAARELEEELGVEATSLRLLSVQAEFVDTGIWTGFFFVVDVHGTPQIMEPHKHDNLEYLTCSELQEANAHPEFEVAIKASASRL